MEQGCGFPTGTVTLLFSDIQDSTGLWERMKDGFRPVLDRHHALMRQQIAAHRGWEVKTEGDSFMVSFDTASDAMKFAVDAQLALAKEDWSPSPQPLRVRMGLHTGDVITVTHPDGLRDYFGPVVNRAARLTAAAHGGQIVVSRITKDLVPASEWSFKDMGVHQLKGLETPEQIFQICHPDFPLQEFPPLKTLNAVRHNLPIPVTTFIGREQEVQDLKERLLKPGNRLVTLFAPGGTGKTRIAEYVAAEIADQFDDGVWLAELADLVDAEQIWPRLLSSLTLHPHPLKEPKDQLRTFLADKKLLLVLDNTEQIPNIADVVSQLITAGPNVKCLVTTRTRLRIRGEQVYPLPMMPIPSDGNLTSVLSHDATILFVERAREACPEFELDERNARHIVELVRKLDGLPLAIELVGARMRGGAVKPLLDRIKDLIFKVDHKGVPLRHENLLETINWSYKDLDAHHSQLLLHLSTFVGGFTVEAAHALCGEACTTDGFDIDGAVQELTDRSLLTTRRAGDDVRYGMLEIIRSFCLKKLEERFDQRYIGILRHQHAEYFLKLAHDLNQLLITETDAWVRLESELPNLRTAMDEMVAGKTNDLAAQLALAMCPLLGRRGYWSERQDRAQEGLGLAKAAFGEVHAVVAGLLNELGKSQQKRGQYEAANPHYQQCLTIRQTLADRHGEALVLNNLAQIANHQGTRTLARELALRSLELMQQVNDSYGLGLVHNTLGSIAAEEDDQEDAERHYEKSLNYRRDVQDQQGIAASLNNLATTAELRGDMTRAERLYDESLEQNRLLGERSAVAACLHNRARLARRRKDFPGAVELAGESLAIRTEIGDRSGIAMSRSLLSNLACEEGNLEDAKRLAEDALEVWRAIGSNSVIVGQLNLAEILHMMNRFGQAIQVYERVYNEAGERKNRHAQGAALMGWAQSALADGKPADAILQLRRARRLFWQLQDTKNLAEGMYQLGKLYEAKSESKSQVRSGWCLHVATGLAPTSTQPPAPEAVKQRFAEFESRHKVLCLHYDPKKPARKAPATSPK